MITYFELGSQKKLNEIVVAGSHDAGITGGGSNVQTQNLDIMGQAKAGVRVFDLRIAAQTTGSQNGQKTATLKAFHADSKLMKNETKTRFVAGLGRSAEVSRTKLRGGAFGEGLEKMLGDARDFVRSPASSNEFLLLKFDKCKNWELIAEMCTSVLGDTLFKPLGNLNTRTLDEVKGKVLVVFSRDGILQGGGAARIGSGIHQFQNLYAGGAYNPMFDGLQYFGKGGTSVFKPFRKKTQNVDKQRKILDKAKQSHLDAVAMMYWTTTGMFESIESRNAGMWDAPNIRRMKRLWAEGLGDFVAGSHPPAPAGTATGMQRRRFMPNIVMIDFADEEKCRHIRELNNLTDAELGALGADV